MRDISKVGRPAAGIDGGRVRDYPRMTLRLPPYVKKALDEAASDAGISAAAVVAASLVETLGLVEPETEAQRLHRQLRAKHRAPANATAILLACSALNLGRQERGPIWSTWRDHRPAELPAGWAVFALSGELGLTPADELADRIPEPADNAADLIAEQWQGLPHQSAVVVGGRAYQALADRAGLPVAQRIDGTGGGITRLRSRLAQWAGEIPAAGGSGWVKGESWVSPGGAAYRYDTARVRHGSSSDVEYSLQHMDGSKWRVLICGGAGELPDLRRVATWHSEHADAKLDMVGNPRCTSCGEPKRFYLFPIEDGAPSQVCRDCTD